MTDGESQPVQTFEDWLEWAEPLAYGALNLKPWEFASLQPGEFLAMLEGYKWRLERKEEFAAYFTAALMNMSGKTVRQTIQAKDLVDPLRDKKEQKKKDKEYLLEKFPKLKRLGGEN